MSMPTCPFCREVHQTVVDLAICWWNHLPSRQLHPDGVVRACFCGKWSGRKPLTVAEHLHLPGSLVCHLKLIGIDEHIGLLAVEKWKRVGERPQRFATSASTTSHTGGSSCTMQPYAAKSALWNPVTKPKGK